MNQPHQLHFDNQNKSSAKASSPSFLVTICALMAVIGVFFFSLRAPSAKARTRIALKMAPSAGLIVLASHQGYFDEEGLEVEVVPVGSDVEALSSLKVNEKGERADFAVSFETLVTKALLSGERLVILSELFSSSSNTVVLYRKEAGIQRPSDLKRKTIGLPSGSASEFVFELFLAGHSLKREDVKIVDVDAETLSKRLVAKELDAIVVGEPKATLAVQGYGEDFGRMETDFYSQTAALVSSREAIEHQKDVPVRLLRALRRALAYYRNEPVEARAKVLAAMGMDPTPENEVMWERARPHLGLSSVLAAMMKEELDWFRSRQRSVRASPEVEDSFEPQYLIQVAPELITYR